MKKSSISLILILLLCSCNRPPQDVRMILNVAGDNRPELEKVIDHYKASGNKEKLKAAYFLIGNMDDKFALDGDAVRKYYPIFDILDSLTQNKVIIPTTSPLVDAKWDSLVKIHGAPSRQDAEVFRDYLTIKSDYLIENIDLAFKLRDESPWCKNISFEQFCNFMLAYRFRNEPLEHWRSFFYNKFRTIRDSVNADSCFQLAQVMHDQIYRRIRVNTVFMEYPFDIPINKMEMARFGACEHNIAYTGMIMRSVGLPVSTDHSPLWGDGSSGHFWSALIMEDGKPFPFEISLKTLRIEPNYTFAKTYRLTFGRQDIELPKNDNDVPLSLLNNHRIDVTNEYTKTFNPVIKLKYPAETKKKYAVICSFTGKDWAVQDWGKIKRNTVVFRNIGAGIVYMVMYYDSGNLSPASDPFILAEDGKIILLSPVPGKTINMLLLRKSHYTRWFPGYLKDMVGGYFQAANKPDFSDSVSLFTIKTVPEKIETAIIDYPAKFRFIRYKTPYSQRGYVGELEFYGGIKSTDTLKLEGRIIGFPEVPSSIGTPYQNAFDGNLLTYFDSYGKKKQWVGLDLKIPKRITKIRYCPRCDTNFILVGDTYELCYWGNGEWISMGEQVAKDQYLEYKNVPSGALYILHNLSRGKEERIFTYEDDKQVFW